MKKNNPIAVIIINKNERTVDETLSLLGRQQISVSFKTIVVDASNGALNDIYVKYPDVEVISFTSKGTKKVTIPEQRNTGIRATESRIIVFIDAGCNPGPTWLKELTTPIMSGGESIVAGGTLSTGKQTFHDSVFHAQLDQEYIEQAPTINLAIERVVFDKIGYFDENLRYGSDMDFTWRARDYGYKIRNAPKALVTHDWGNMRSELKRADHYGQAKIILYRKHRFGILNFARREFALFFYIAFVIGLPLTFLFPVYPLLILVPVLKNLKLHPLQLVAINFMTAYGAVKEFLKP